MGRGVKRVTMAVEQERARGRNGARKRQRPPKACRLGVPLEHWTLDTGHWTLDDGRKRGQVWVAPRPLSYPILSYPILSYSIL